MDLKNAVAVCLISLFSATLVVLIARSLDSQAASHIEPQLAQIVEELRAIRTQGGMPAASVNPTAAEPLANGLVVYYFHGNIRCATCRAIESQARNTVYHDFAAQLESGKMAWKVLNYEQPRTTELAEKFDVHMANVVLVQMEAGEIETWKRLDQVWALVGDESAFADFIRTEINQMLDQSGPATELSAASQLPDLPENDRLPPPLPQDDTPANLPVPELPVPE